MFNTDNGAGVPSRPLSTARALIRRALAPMALMAVLGASVLGMASPAQAVTDYYYEGTYSLNTYYGWGSGWGAVTSDKRRFSVQGYALDTRNDGFCTVTQARAVNGSLATVWIKGPSTCSTTTQTYGASAMATTSFVIAGIQVRTCQADRYGNVTGTCSSAVNWANTRVIWF